MTLDDPKDEGHKVFSHTTLVIPEPVTEQHNRFTGSVVRGTFSIGASHHFSFMKSEG